jgi:hypothetical protein
LTVTTVTYQDKPDAILFTGPACMHAGSGTPVPEHEFGKHVQKKHGPILGGIIMIYFIIDGPYKGYWFGRLDVTQEYAYPKGHPRAGESRYEWSEADVGVLYGHLKPATDPGEVRCQHCGHVYTGENAAKLRGGCCVICDEPVVYDPMDDVVWLRAELGRLASENAALRAGRATDVT